jgi:hypothetical protein
LGQEPRAGSFVFRCKRSIILNSLNNRKVEIMTKKSFRMTLLLALGVFVLSVSARPSSAAMNIKWGRPTQAERDAKRLACVPDNPRGHFTEVLVYIQGMEPGRTYEIEVEVKEKAGGDTVKEKLEVEDLESSPVPVLPPADPKIEDVVSLFLSWGRPTQVEREDKQLKFVHGGFDNGTEILVYVDGLNPGKTYEIEVEVKEKGAGGDPSKEKLSVEDLEATPVPELPPADPK